MTDTRAITEFEEATDFVEKNLSASMVLPMVRAALEDFSLTDKDKGDLVLNATAAALTTILAKYITTSREAYDDKIDGLESDLFQAVEAIYTRGGKNFVAKNYPQWVAQLEANERARPAIVL